MNRNVMELVGSASLKEIVAETTDVVEKMCIETAVNLTKQQSRRGGRDAGPVAPEPVCEAAQIRAAEQTRTAFGAV